MPGGKAFQIDPGRVQHPAQALRIDGLKAESLHRSLQFGGELAALSRVLLEHLLHCGRPQGLRRAAKALFSVTADADQIMNGLSIVL